MNGAAISGTFAVNCALEICPSSPAYDSFRPVLRRSFFLAGSSLRNDP